MAPGMAVWTTQRQEPNVVWPRLLHAIRMGESDPFQFGVNTLGTGPGNDVTQITDSPIPAVVTGGRFFFHLGRTSPRLVADVGTCIGW